MAFFHLEIEALGSFTGGNAPLLEVLVGGAVVGSSSVTTSAATYGFTLEYTGNYPSSVSIRFNSSSGDPGDSISLNAVRINGQNADSYGLLSGTYIPRGSNVTVNTVTGDFLFGRTAPVSGDLGTVDITGTGSGETIWARDPNGDVIDSGAGNDRVVGKGGDDALIAGIGDDTIHGAEGNDIILGGAGDDRLYGESGDDIFYGEADNDRLIGGDGNDVLNGGVGNDILNGGNDNDILYGEDGDDRLIGGNGDDIMFGDTGADVLSGGNGNDTIFGGSEDDTIVGGLGNDSLDGGTGNDTISGNQGDDIIDGEDGNDFLMGGNDDDVINGMNDNDIVQGEDGNDELYGDAGDDIVVGGSGADIMDGGADNDVLHGHGVDAADVNTILRANPGVVFSWETNSFYQFVNANVNYATAQSAAAAATINGVSGHLVTITSAFENSFVQSIITDDSYTSATDNEINTQWVWDAGAEAGLHFSTNATPENGLFNSWAGGQPQNNTEHNAIIYTTGVWHDWSANSSHSYVIEWDAGFIDDDNAIDTISGGAGNDFIYGYGGNDILAGDDGDDYIFGHSGDDTITGGNGGDHIYGGTGADNINAGGNNDTIYLANGDFASGEVINGGANNDELLLINATTVDFSTGTLTGLETLTGSSGNDDVTYSIEQALGFTTIDLAGGTDNSRVQVSGTVDVTALGTPTVTNTENGFLLGSSLADNLTISGAQLDSLVYGTGTIDFSGGSDVLNLTSTSVNLNALGLSNASIAGLERINFADIIGTVINLSGQTEVINVFGNNGDDTITGGSGDDLLRGGNGVDTITGGAGDNRIFGDGGDDIITGGLGADDINGGGGNDIINLANGDFAIGEIIDGSSNNDELILINATTVDFSTGTLTGLETLTGSSGNDNVTYTFQQALAFTTIDLGLGTDTSNIQVSGTVDATVLGTPTVSNAENGQVIGSSGNDTLTISGAQLDALIYGTGTIAFSGGTDILNITSTSADLNTLGITNGSITGLEQISAATAASGVTIILSGQTEGFTVTGGGFADTLTGGSGNDTITGGGGADILNGGGGADTITSGSTDQWTAAVNAVLAANAGVVYSEETNSFYRLVTANNSWTNANTNANGSTLTGLTGNGYLATITSQAENDFILNSVTGGNRAWIGGSDAGSEGTWFWTGSSSGPESGITFHTGGSGGGAINGFYENWVAGDPSNGNSAWDYTEFRADGTWWSNANVASLDSVIEWDADNLLSTVEIVTINGGSGADILFGDDGIDLFIFETATWDATDTINNFDSAGRDMLDISDLLSGFTYGSDDLNDFVRLTEASGNTTIAVDADGTGGYTNVAVLNGVTGLDLYQMIAADNLIVA